METSEIGGTLLPSAHCRICGSFKLNKFHFALELSDKIGLYQILTRDSSVDQLIRPCNCRGEFAYAHRICLSDWIETTKHEYCDICRFRYEIHFFERTLFDWISETQQMKRILKVLSLSSLIYYISFLGIITHWSTKNMRNVLCIVVYSSACIWIATCSLYLIITTYDFIKQFTIWKQVNKRVVVEPNRNPQLSSKPRPKDVLKSSGFKPG